MSKDKVPDEQIIKKIAESGTIYRLTASQLADLRQAGVSDQVINYMQMTYLDAVRREQAREDLRYWSPVPAVTGTAASPMAGGDQCNIT